MSHQSYRRGVRDPRQLVYEILSTPQRLDTQGFLALVRGQYEDAIERRDQNYIRDLQRECAGVAMSEEEVLRFLPNPYGRNFRSAPRRRPLSDHSGETQVMCQDIRLQDNPDLPVIRRDAAGGAPGTAGTVTNTLVAGSEKRSVEGSACRTQSTGVQTLPILTTEYHRSEPGAQIRSRPEHRGSQRPNSRNSGHYRSRNQAPSRTTDRDRSAGRSSVERISSMIFYNRRSQLDRSHSPDRSEYPRRPNQSVQNVQDGKETRRFRGPQIHTGRNKSVPDIAITIAGNQRVVGGERGVKRTREESPHQRSRPSKRKVCPVRGCGAPVGKLKQHLQQVHIPGLFHDGETPAELANSQFQSLRRHALEMMSRFLFGREGTVNDLMDLVNEESDITDANITSETQQAMEALAWESRWRRPRTFSLEPVNSPAALIHWRPLSFILSLLSTAQREEIFKLFGERWTVPIAEEQKDKKSRRYCRPNPSRRRRRRRAREEEKEERRQHGSQREDDASQTIHRRQEITMVPRREKSPSTRDKEDTQKDKPLGSLTFSRRLSPIPEEDPTSQTDRTQPKDNKSLSKVGARVCLKQGSKEVGTSQLSMQKFNLTTEMMLTLEKDNSPELDYEGTPSPQKSTISSPLDEESLLKSPSSTQMEVVDKVNEDPASVESSGMSSNQIEESSAVQPMAEMEKSHTEEKTTVESDSSYAEVLRTNLPTKEQLGTTALTYAEVCASKPKTSSPVGVVQPRTLRDTRNDQNKAFDSHFHWDRLCWNLNYAELEESAIYRHAEVSPRVPVELSGGVMIFCDPAGYKHVPNRTDPKWRISVGVHPRKIKDLTPPRLQHLQSLLLQPRVVAFGEIGLDYSESDTDRERQRAKLEELLSLCSPRHVLVLHIRGNKKEHMSEQAFKDCFESVKKHVPRDQRIHLHCFSGGLNQVTKWSEAFPNCHFGYTGKVARFIKS